jgi:AbrB family looped-hinge helix DNA binding protein
MSQEKLAEHLGISRQTVTKWENEEAVPDIKQCMVLASLFNITLEDLTSDISEEEILSLAPRGKRIFGVVVVSEQGRIQIPKEARRLYNFKEGDRMIVLGDDDTNGIALLKTDGILEFADLIRAAKPLKEDSDE